jgi:hypothetical protein
LLLVLLRLLLPRATELTRPPRLKNRNCVDSRSAFHDSAHGFSEIARPGAKKVVSTRGVVEKKQEKEGDSIKLSLAEYEALANNAAMAEKLKEKMEMIKEKLEEAKKAQAMGGLSEEEAKLPFHAAVCDVCAENVRGIRYKCTSFLSLPSPTEQS